MPSHGQCCLISESSVLKVPSTGLTAYLRLSLRHKLYYLIMCFARANLFVLSYTFMLKSFPDRKSPLFRLRLMEIVGIAFFWTWFGAVLRAIPGTGTRILYLLISFAVTSPLHVQVRDGNSPQLLALS